MSVCTRDSSRSVGPSFLHRTRLICTQILGRSSGAWRGRALLEQPHSGQL